MKQKTQRLVEIEVRGIEKLKGAVEQNQGVLITPNHPGHADPLIVYEAAEKIDRGLYFMAAWQVLAKQRPLHRLVLRHSRQPAQRLPHVPRQATPLGGAVPGVP